jgi:hypothetical protein
MSNAKGEQAMALGKPLRMRLSQKGLARAELVVWPMRRQDGEAFVDIRLWFSQENAEQWMPTKKGVRVPAERVQGLRKLLGAKSGELILSETAMRELRGRWIEDNSGRAFDLRYFVKTDSYTGWDKRGVRVRLVDCGELLTHLRTAEELVRSAELPKSGSNPRLEIRVAQDLLDAVFR